MIKCKLSLEKKRKAIDGQIKKKWICKVHPIISLATSKSAFAWARSTLNIALSVTNSICLAQYTLYTVTNNKCKSIIMLLIPVKKLN